jgi:2-keto-4-pentenoate hydratase/2-oxohepta-3-ene-1,7-dioic acid hydratase in catechol pathway
VVVIPRSASGVTAEAELGLIIGETCKDVPERGAASVVAGVTPVLDFTAEDAIRQNPRYIPWAKGFDDFFAFGPAMHVLTPTVWTRLPAMRVTTVHNGVPIASDQISNMKMSPAQLVQHFSAGRTLEAGAVICCGTPGAVRVSDGDTVEARITNLGILKVSIRSHTWQHQNNKGPSNE